MKIPPVKGFRDVFPDETVHRRGIVSAAVGVLESYDFREVELPLLERAALFSSSVGATTDIVEKEMYAFEDRDGTVVALRPEGTASLVRAYTDAGLGRSEPEARFYYVGPMFRRERPQKGRFRQFTQIGAECIGRADAAADAEVICMAADICEATGIASARMEINSLGDGNCRPAYREALLAYGRERTGQLCENCRNRLERNPLRILDCKEESCRVIAADAPQMSDFLCAGCKEHHDRVLDLLGACSVEVVANPNMVRGLDYYCRTAFEIIAEGLGAQDAIGGGGRYDGLVGALGGPDLAGVGFAFGVERMQMAAGGGAVAETAEFVLAPLEESADGAALALARRMRRGGMSVAVGTSARRLKVQMKKAAKAGARYVVIIGEAELASGRASVRDMDEQRDYPACVPLDAADAVAVSEAIKRAKDGEA